MILSQSKNRNTLSSYIFFCNLPQNFIQTDGRDAGTGAFGSDIVDTEPFTRLA